MYIYHLIIETNNDSSGYITAFSVGHSKDEAITKWLNLDKNREEGYRKESIEAEKIEIEGYKIHVTPNMKNE
ncbi:hypothetical protein D3C74_494370 [compost metagenome]